MSHTDPASAMFKGASEHDKPVCGMDSHKGLQFFVTQCPVSVVAERARDP
jgi:hypothetical protein